MMLAVLAGLTLLVMVLYVAARGYFPLAAAIGLAILAVDVE